MNPLKEIAYHARKALLTIYGPAELDEEHDPIKQLEREHEQELREERQAEADSE